MLLFSEKRRGRAAMLQLISGPEKCSCSCGYVCRSIFPYALIVSPFSDIYLLEDGLGVRVIRPDVVHGPPFFDSGGHFKLKSGKKYQTVLTCTEIFPAFI